MKKNKLLLAISALLLSSGLLMGFASEANPKPDNEGGVFICEDTGEEGPMFYAADYSTDIADEPSYSTQNTYTFSSMNYNNAHKYYRGDSVKVAVIDSGLNYTHEDFADSNGNQIIQGNSRTIDNTSGSWLYYQFSSGYQSKIVDSFGHGTNVASVIASQINELGCAGIAPNVELYIYKVTNTSNGYEWTAINSALQYCVDEDIDVVNMSFQAYEHAVEYNGSSMAASTGCSTTMVNKLNACYNAGITLVAAAGNFNTSEPSYPASNNHVISVGSLAESSTYIKAGYSNTYGIDLVAPGTVYVADKGTSSAYKKTSGTSFSAPIVTAAIALYKQQNPSATPDQIESALYASCDTISGSPAWAGNGRLNIDKFLGVESVGPTNIVVNNPEVINDELELEVGDTFDLDWTVNGVGTFDKSVTFSTDSGTNNVVSVSSSGKITAIGEGEDFVYITSTIDNSVYTAIDVTVKTTAASPTVSSVSISPSSLSLDLYGTKTGTLSATVHGTNNPSQAVTWSSSNTSIATVSSTGVVTAKATGNATITATSQADGTKSGTCTVTVTDSTVHVTGVTLNKNSTSITVGGSETLTATVSPNNATNKSLNWSSSNTGVATVNNGVVTGVSAGSAIITATTVDGGYQASCSVTITAPTTGTTTFSVSTKTSATISGDYPDGSSVSYNNNGSNSSDQMTSGKRELWTISGYTGSVITSITAQLHKNSSSGSGTVSITNAGSSISLSKTNYSSSDLTSSYKSYTLYSGSFECEGDIVITLTSTANSFWCNQVSVTYEVQDLSDKIVDTLSASYSGGTIYIGDELNESSISVTASFTNSSKYPDAVLSSSNYSITGFNSSSAGSNQLTITYTGSLSTSATPLTTTLTLTIVEDTISNVSISSSKSYHPGETIFKSDLTVNVTHISGKQEVVTDYTFNNDGYQFKYSDANSGGSSTQKQLSISYLGQNYWFNVNVSRNAYTAPSNTNTTISSSEFDSSNLSKSSGTASDTNVTIAGIAFTVTTNAYAYKTGSTYYLSFGKGIGSIQNTSAFSNKLTSASFTQKSGSRNDGIIYVSTNGSSWTLTSNANFNTNNYYFVKIAYESTSTSYSNISSIVLGFYGSDTPEAVANYIMYEDTNNQCTTKFATAKGYFENMTKDGRVTFMTSDDYVISTARERLLAWAAHLGKTISPSADDYVISKNPVLNVFETVTVNAGTVIAAIAAIIGLSAVGGYFFIRRRKEQ